MPYLTADQSPSPELRTGCSPEFGDYSLTLFSDEYLGSLYPAARSELRSKSRGVILLTYLIGQLHSAQALESDTGVYLYCGFGPYSLKTQQVALAAPKAERTALIEKALPPKDYFIATPAMKAAQLSIEFGLHGPLMALYSPHHGFDQAFEFGRADLYDEVVKASLMAGIFALDDLAELPRFLSASRHLCECVFFQYATHPEDVLDSQGSPGKFGPLTSIIERNPIHE